MKANKMTTKEKLPITSLVSFFEINFRKYNTFSLFSIKGSDIITGTSGRDTASLSGPNNIIWQRSQPINNYLGHNFVSTIKMPTEHVSSLLLFHVLGSEIYRYEFSERKLVILQILGINV